MVCNLLIFKSAFRKMMKPEGDVPSIKSLLKMKKRYDAPAGEELPNKYRSADC